MKSNSHISYLLTDHLSLSSYQEGKDVTLNEVKRRLMIIAREHNHVIPHHYLRLVSDSSFAEIKTKSQIFTRGLIQLADYFLEKRNNRIYVKIENFNVWQEQIAYMPPMLLICALSLLLTTSFRTLSIINILRQTWDTRVLFLHI